MKLGRKFLLTLWLCLGLTVTGKAALLTSESVRINMVRDAQFLEDKSGQLTLDQVRGMGEQFRHWDRAGIDINFGFTTSAYWIRLPLQRTNAASKDWLLEIDYVKLDELDVYPLGSSSIHTGSHRPFVSRPYFDRFFVLPIEVSTEPTQIYLRVTSRYPLTVPLKIWQPDAYRQQQQSMHALQFLYYGGLIVLALYGLLIYLAIRDTRFLIFCAYDVSVGLGIFAGNGYGRQMLWPDAPVFDEISQSLFLSFGAYFAVLFARQLILLPHERTWLSRSLQASQYVFLLPCLLIFLHLAFPIMLHLANQILMVNSVVMGFLVSGASIRAFRKRRPGIRFFLAGWMVLWLGVSTAALRAFGWVPSNPFTSYAVQLSTAVEMLLVALALADLLRLEHEARQKAQAEALASNRALLAMTQRSEEKLKHAVKERTDQLENSLKLEKELRAQYVRFGSMISHEFRTPLSIIQSQASLLRKENERGIDQVIKRLEIIGSATHRLTAMFDKWLHSDAITETLEKLDIKPLELTPWLRTLIKTNSHLLHNHQVHLKLPSEIGSVSADEYHLGVALINLIDNAAKYSPVNSTIIIETRLKPTHIGIAVIDNGSGIAQEVQDKVFSDFFRISSESTVRGVGLGLSIVQRIARAHDGYVELSSTPGQGATFCIWLPTNAAKEHQ